MSKAMQSLGVELRPFISFYGGKWRDTPRLYPDPQHSTVIEPFAGSAGYSVRHFARNVILIEKDPAIAAVWRYLLSVSPREVLALPDIGVDETVEDLWMRWDEVAGLLRSHDWADERRDALERERDEARAGIAEWKARAERAERERDEAQRQLHQVLNPQPPWNMSCECGWLHTCLTSSAWKCSRCGRTQAAPWSDLRTGANDE